jgi:hypothetical protein
VSCWLFIKSRHKNEMIYLNKTSVHAAKISRILGARELEWEADSVEPCVEHPISFVPPTHYGIGRSNESLHHHPVRSRRLPQPSALQSFRSRMSTESMKNVRAFAFRLIRIVLRRKSGRQQILRLTMHIRIKVKMTSLEKISSVQR